ncbi:MAG: metallophosphoesterase [Anaerolineaceae bacterium]|nr:metallophosphoesterase [Anaerolineaceae bacterium]
MVFVAALRAAQKPHISLNTPIPRDPPTFIRILMIRIAVLADIHGNLPAFESALEHVSQQKVDQIILAGDIVNGSPDSKACWTLALSLGCPILRGNHER